MSANTQSGGRTDRAAVASPSSVTEHISLHDTVLTSLEESKAEDIVHIDLGDEAALADEMIVVSGRSNRHVSAIADQLTQRLKKTGFRDFSVEGLPHCDWVLVDAGDVIVHIFRPEVRTFYNLEKLWSPRSPVERVNG